MITVDLQLHKIKIPKTKSALPRWDQKILPPRTRFLTGREINAHEIPKNSYGEFRCPPIEYRLHCRPAVQNIAEKKDKGTKYYQRCIWGGTGCCPGTTGAMYAAPRGVAMRGNTIGFVYPVLSPYFFLSFI